MNAIEKAVTKCDPPTQAELARRLDLKGQQIWAWIQRGYASPKHALRIQEVTGVPCAEVLSDARKNKKSKRTK